MGWGANAFRESALATLAPYLPPDLLAQALEDVTVTDTMPRGVTSYQTGGRLTKIEASAGAEDHFSPRR
jgi:hypothetical protein